MVVFFCVNQCDSFVCFFVFVGLGLGWANHLLSMKPYEKWDILHINWWGVCGSCCDVIDGHPMGPTLVDFRTGLPLKRALRGDSKACKWFFEFSPEEEGP